MVPKKLSKRERKKLLTEKAQKAEKTRGVGVGLLWQETGKKSRTKAVIVNKVFTRE